MSEHPFAQYIRILGKGKKGSRALTHEEAYAAFKMILAGEVIPEQLGAFLMLMRVKEETGAEVSGFVNATRETLNLPKTAVDLDWSSYAGKKRHLPWYILSTLLLAENGIRVFMHGAAGHTAGRIYTKNVLPTLGIQPCKTVDEVQKQLDTANFAYMDLEFLCPRMHQIIELRSFLGLRSPVHTISRELNPFSAPYVMQGIFHPGYRAIHEDAAACLKDSNVAILKGEGGEVERNPDVPCPVNYIFHGEPSVIEWPALFSKRHIKDEDLNVERVSQVWNGEDQDEYAIASVIGTTAIALHLTGKANSVEAAQALAMSLWDRRNKGRFSAAA